MHVLIIGRHSLLTYIDSCLAMHLCKLPWVRLVDSDMLALFIEAKLAVLKAMYVEIFAVQFGSDRVLSVQFMKLTKKFLPLRLVLVLLLVFFGHTLLLLLDEISQLLLVYEWRVSGRMVELLWHSFFLLRQQG